MEAKNSTNTSENIGIGMCSHHVYTVSCWVVPRLLWKSWFWTLSNLSRHRRRVWELFSTLFLSSYCSIFLQPTVYSVGSVAQAEFTPILRGYIVSGFKENEILKIRIKSQVLFKQNLVHLKPVTNWKINYNPGTGEYEIVEVKEIVEVEGA